MISQRSTLTKYMLTANSTPTEIRKKQFLDSIGTKGKRGCMDHLSSSKENRSLGLKKENHMIVLWINPLFFFFLWINPSLPKKTLIS